MVEEESARYINLDIVEPKGELETETYRSHVIKRHKCVTESEEVKFPFNRSKDSLALLSVYRYAKRIKAFLGWESFRGDFDTAENSLENLFVNENQCSKSKKLDLFEERKKNNCTEEKENIFPEDLFVREELCLNDNQSLGLSLLFESDNNNFQEKCTENEKLCGGNYANACDIKPELSRRSSYHLHVNNLSDYPTDNEIELLTNSYCENKNRTLEDFKNNDSGKETFRSEFILYIQDSGTDKAILCLNSDFDKLIVNDKKNIIMDKNLLQENGTTDVGLALRDEDSIIQDENISTNENEKYIRNNERQLQEFIPEDSIKIVSNFSHENVNGEINLESHGTSEQNSEIFSETEKKSSESFKNSLNEELITRNEQNKHIHEKTEKSFDSQNDDLSQNTNGLLLQKTFVAADNCKKSINNNVKENYENNMSSTKLETPLKAHVQCTKAITKPTLYKDTKSNEKQELDTYDEETVCGLGSFKPQWLQPYATAKMYVILYSIIGILHGSYYTYLIGTLSTLEKRFAFKSKISGVIMIADEITPLILGMIIGYYASKAHRPRIVALGMILSAGCCFVTLLPYFIYGSMQNPIFSDHRSNTGPEYCDPNIEIESCNPDRPQNLLAVLLLIFGSFLKGFGNLAYYAIGLVYLDDNSDKQSTPIYLAIALALRLLGPLVGFLMSSGFLKYYENPFYDPGFGPDDPRWIGAWWIGFFLQGILLVIFTIPIALFPRRLPSQKKIEKVEVAASEDGLKNIFKGLISALKRLGKNPVFIVLIINTTMKIFGHFGHAIMLPKYMENQFRLSASEASLYSGAITILCIIISTLLGGFLIWKFTPRIKILLGGMIVSEIILCVGYLILMVPRCQTSEMLHFGINEEGLILNSICNRNCDCSTSSFTPFCGSDGKTLYFSPCYAGCTEDVTSAMPHKMIKEFTNCSCVDQQQLGATISEGFCPDENCRSQMTAYLIILFFMVTVSNLFTVAATMILLRSVHPNDKSVALGTFETFICLLGFIPFPVTYGALVDSACLVWEKSCGETGNCWFYDMEKYNYLLHGTSALFCSLSVVCLIMLYFFSPRVRNLYVEENEEAEDDAKYVDIKLDTVSGSVTKL